MVQILWIFLVFLCFAHNVVIKASIEFHKRAFDLNLPAPEAEEEHHRSPSPVAAPSASTFGTPAHNPHLADSQTDVRRKKRTMEEQLENKRYHSRKWAAHYHQLYSKSGYENAEKTMSPVEFEKYKELHDNYHSYRDRMKMNTLQRKKDITKRKREGTLTTEDLTKKKAESQRNQEQYQRRKRLGILSPSQLKRGGKRNPKIPLPEEKKKVSEYNKKHYQIRKQLGKLTPSQIKAKEESVRKRQKLSS